MRINYKQIPETFQYLTLSFTLFSTNNLFIYAAAGAFGFFCSLVPIVLMIAAVLMRFFRTSPEKMIDFISSSYGSLYHSFDMPNVIASILQIKGVGLFEIIVGISLIWMARRFFLYVMQGISCIFRITAKQKPVIISVISLAIEIMLVVIVALLLFLSNTFESFIAMTGIINLMPFFLKKSGELLMKFLPSGIYFLLILLTYRIAPGCKPKWKICAFASLGCTAIFFIVDAFFHIFIDMSRYNLIYGVLSNVIVLLLEVYTFFMLFLYFAQFIFVCQYFDMLLFEQMYLLPGKDANRLEDAFKRLLFIQPKHFTNSATIDFAADDQIFSAGDDSSVIYYVFSGTVRTFANNHMRYHSAGAFFGEADCVTYRPRTESASAETDVKLIPVTHDMFKELLDFSPDVANRLLKHLF